MFIYNRRDWIFRILHIMYYLCTCIYLVISNYCSDTPPTVTNANSPAISRSINSTTVYTCNVGYQSSGGTIGPTLTCNPFNSSYGYWTMTYSCVGML